ncbi:MAG: sulfur carrier protein ThiS [Nitrososphaerales archaeon]
MTSEIEITVKYLALVREMTHSDKDLIHMPEGSKVSQLIDQIAKSHGNQIRSNLLEDQGRTPTSFAIIVNGDILERNKFDQTLLKDGDEVAIIPPIAGG